MEDNKCWRRYGCPFNSNNSLNYMKCLQKKYSINQCKKDNQNKWNERDLKVYGKI